MGISPRDGLDPSRVLPPAVPWEGWGHVVKHDKSFCPMLGARERVGLPPGFVLGCLLPGFAAALARALHPPGDAIAGGSWGDLEAV